MSHRLSSRGLSARSLGGYLRYPGSPCDAFGPGGVVYSPGACQGGPVLCGDHQEACYEPPSYQAPCYGPRTGAFCSPSQMNYPGPWACGSAGLAPVGYGGGRAQPGGCGPGFSRASSLSSRSYQSLCSQPPCSSRYFGPTY